MGIIGPFVLNFKEKQVQLIKFLFVSISLANNQFVGVVTAKTPVLCALTL